MPHPAGRPWIIAHRGASARAPENTIEAFVLARALGADAVELDVRRTADGTLVVHHDDTLAGATRPIIAMTRAEVARLAPSVPDFAEVLTACTGLWIDVEIKNDPGEPDWDPQDYAVAIIAADHADADIVVTSFNAASVAAASRTGLRTGWLIGRGIDPAMAAVEAAQAGHQFLLPHHTTLAGDAGTRIVQAAARAGVELAVWTVDDPADIARLAALGVGAIATNVPDVAVAILTA